MTGLLHHATGAYPPDILLLIDNAQTTSSSPDQWRLSLRCLADRSWAPRKKKMVGEEGLEPSCPCEHSTLNPACLPIPPLAHETHPAVWRFNAQPGYPIIALPRAATRCLPSPHPLP